MRRLFTLLVLAAVTYGGLAALWRVVDGVYANVAVGILNFTMNNLGGGASGVYQVGSGHRGQHFVATLSHTQWPFTVTRNVMLDQYYMEMVLLVALIVWSPVVRNRRGWSLVLSMVVLHIWFFVVTYILLFDTMINQSPSSPFAIGLFWRGVLSKVNFFLNISPVSEFLVPMLLWIVFTFRRGDLAGLMGEPAGADAVDSDLRTRPETKSS